jgi:hypothetical protein
MDINMTTTAVRLTGTKPVAMTSLRGTALIAGGLYLVTIFASIPALLLHKGVLDDPDFIVGFGSDTRVLWAGYRDLVTALACIGTAIALFPVVKRHNEAVALGFVAARVLEAAVIVIGVISLLSAVTLRQDLGSSPEALTRLAPSAGCDRFDFTTSGTERNFCDWPQACPSRLVHVCQDWDMTLLHGIALRPLPKLRFDTGGNHYSALPQARSHADGPRWGVGLRDRERRLNNYGSRSRE